MARDVVPVMFAPHNLPSKPQSSSPAQAQFFRTSVYARSRAVAGGIEASEDNSTAYYGNHGPATARLYQAAQSGYSAMDYSQYANQGYSYPPGYTDPYAQQQQSQYQPTPPQIRNPFAPPPPSRPSYNTQNAGFDPEHEAQLAQWQSAYAPQEQQERGKKGDRGKYEKQGNANLEPVGPRVPAQSATEAANVKLAAAVPQEEKKITVVRKGGGQTWTDESLTQWDPTQFRIMVGNLAGEVTDDSLAKAFAQYGVSKARVVRDKRTTKSKGFGFVSFTDGEQGFKAAREMVGKYIGSHPVTIQRSKTDLRPTVQKDNHRKKGKINKNREKGGKKDDPLAAHTGTHIEKKPMKNAGGFKVIG